MSSSPPTRNGIADMPVELVRHVCSFLSPACFAVPPQCGRPPIGHANLSRLSKTCRRLRDIVQPLIFHCFPDFYAASAVHLARTLIARPDLAQHMKRITVHDPLGQLSDADRQFVEHVVVDVLKLPAIDPFWNVDGEDIYRLVPLELVLLHTPNLEFLRLPLDSNWNLHLLPQMNEVRDPWLTKLHSLEVNHFFIAGDRFDSSGAAISAIAEAAPNLVAMCLPSLNYSCAIFPYPMQHLRRLYFQGNSCIGPEYLAEMLEGAPVLEMFALHWDPLSDAYEFVDDRRAYDAWEVLEERKDSLREIRLDIRTDTELGGDEGQRESLKDFEKLEVLKVNGHALSALRGVWERKNRHARVDSFLSGMFPPGIREVTFWGLDGLAMRAAMQRFAQVVAVGRYPKLERVTLAPSEKSDRSNWEIWLNRNAWNGVRAELEEAFGKGGVRFDISSDMPYWAADRLER